MAVLALNESSHRGHAKCSLQYAERRKVDSWHWKVTVDMWQTLRLRSVVIGSCQRLLITATVIALCMTRKEVSP